MVFQMELGEASRYRFCCEDAGCSKIDVDETGCEIHGRQLTRGKHWNLNT